MKNEQDEKMKIQSPVPLSDESLVGVAGGDTSTPGQPTKKPIRNDTAANCSDFHQWYGYPPNYNPRFCRYCAHKIGRVEDHGPTSGDTLIICELH